MSIQWSERKRKMESRGVESFLLRQKSLSKTLNQLNALGRVSNINLIFLFAPLRPASNAKTHEIESFFPEASSHPRSVNCRTFFIIEWRNFLSQAGGENESILGLRMENRRKISFLLRFPNHCVLLFSDSII